MRGVPRSCHSISPDAVDVARGGVALFLLTELTTTGFLDNSDDQDLVPSPHVVPVAMDDSEVDPVALSSVAFEKLPDGAKPPRLTVSPAGACLSVHFVRAFVFDNHFCMAV